MVYVKRTEDAAVVLRRIKKAYRELRNLKKQENTLLRSLFLDTHAWVEGQIADGSFKDAKAAITALAHTLRTPRTTVENWNYSGKFVVENGLTQCDMTACRYVKDVRFKVSKADLLKAVQMLRDNENRGTIIRFLREAKFKTGKDSAERARRFERMGMKPKSILQIELRAACTLAHKVFGQDVRIEVRSGAGEDLLLVVKEN